MKLSDYCEVPDAFKEVELTENEGKALLQEIIRLSSMEPKVRGPEPCTREALEKLIEAIQ